MSNYILTSNGELYHYGVKGMKWGVRKAKAKQISGKLKRMSGYNTYRTELTDSVKDDVTNHELFKQYRTEAAGAWKKYLESADEFDRDYDRTVSKIRKSKEYKDAFAKAEKQALDEGDEGTRQYEKYLGYWDDGYVSRHPLYKAHEKRAATYEANRDAAYASAKKLSDAILLKYGNKTIKSHTGDMTAKEIVESSIADIMMRDYYSNNRPKHNEYFI